jgi:hypothetical protein
MLLRIGFCAILGSIPGEVAEHSKSVMREILAFRSARKIIDDWRYTMISEAEEFDCVCNRACLLRTRAGGNWSPSLILKSLPSFDPR